MVEPKQTLLALDHHSCRCLVGVVHGALAAAKRRCCGLHTRAEEDRVVCALGCQLNSCSSPKLWLRSGRTHVCIQIAREPHFGVDDEKIWLKTRPGISQCSMWI